MCAGGPPRSSRDVHRRALGYSLAATLGALCAFALACVWLGVTTPGVGLALGAASALLGAFTTETLVEALVLSLLVGLLGFVLLAFVPAPDVLKAGAVPAGAGLCVGKLAAGAWREWERGA